MEEEIQQSYYAILPANVRYDKDLTPNAKLLYAEITSLCNAKGYCWATNKYFADLYGVTKISISNWISELEKKGYIENEIIYADENKQILGRHLKICNIGIKEIFNRGIEENFNRPIKENFNNNNKDKNNKNKNNKKENNISDVVSSVEDEDLRNVLKEFIKMRSTIKKPLTAYGLNLIINKLNKITPNIEEQIQVVEQSIERCWQGVFPLQKDTKQDSFTKFAQLAQDYNYEE